MAKVTSYLHKGVIYAANQDGGYFNPITNKPLELPAELRAIIDHAETVTDSADAVNNEGIAANASRARRFAENNPHTEGTRAWFMYELEFLAVEYDKYARLAELSELWDQNSLDNSQSE